MKRSRKPTSMHQDVPSGTYVYGYGGRVNRLNRRIQRAVRKRLVDKIVKAER